MTTYLLDTNACIALINAQRGQRPAAIPTRGRPGECDSAVVDCGIRALVRRREEPAQGEQHARLDAFFAGPLEWTLFDEEDARAAGTIRAELETIGKPIGAYDVLLAGQARRHGATLVTSNTKEFARVSGLKWEDWAASRR